MPRTVAAALTLLTLFAPACRKHEAGRVLVVGHQSPLPTVALHGASHDRSAFNILANVYETLVERGPDLSLRPLLAESWYSPDRLTWVFKLRGNVRRHDGRILNADDVVRSIERSQKEAWTAGALAPVATVIARGLNEVVFTTTEPIDTLPARLVYVAISGLPEQGGATGPYRIKTWSPTGSVLLEAFKDYHGGASPIELVEFRIIADPQERARRLIAGDLHFMEEISPPDMARLRAASGVRAVNVPGFVTAYLAFDTGRKETPYIKGRNPFADPRVREAISLAVDRRALVDGPLNGYADVTEQLAQSGQIGFDEGRTPVAPDPGRARELLKAAGYPDGFEVPLDYLSGTVDEVARVLVTQLAAVKIRVAPRGGPSSDFLGRVASADTSFYLLRWVQPSEEIQESYTWLLHTRKGNSGTMNGGGFSNARLDALLAAADHERDEGIRADALREATRIVLAERPILPLYVQRDLYAFSSTLDFEPLPRQQFGTVLKRMRWKD